MNKLVVCVLLFSLCTLSYATTPAQLFDSVAKYQFINAPKSYHFLQQLQKKEASLPDSSKGKLHNELGIHYAITGKTQLAIAEFKKVLRIAEPQSVRRASAYSNIANVYKSLGKYDYANKVLLKAWKIYQALGKEQLQYSILGEMAANDYYALNWNRSMRRTLAVIRKMQDADNQKFLHIQKQRLANLYFSLGWQKKAIPVYLACERYYKTQTKEQLNLAYI